MAAQSSREAADLPSCMLVGLRAPTFPSGVSHDGTTLFSTDEDNSSNLNIPATNQDDRVLYTVLSLTLALSAASYFSQDGWIKGIVPVPVFITVHFVAVYKIACFAIKTQTPLLDTVEVSSCSIGYTCITEFSDPFSAQIGYIDHIPRWARRSEPLKYVICAETFPNLDDSLWVASELRRAMDQWKGVGVRFQLVGRSCEAHFRVTYQALPANGDTNALASAFLPNADACPDKRTLRIYRLAFANSHREHLSNILSHEVGHILGLRHEFSMEGEPRWWSATWGKRNRGSVMEYHPSVSMLVNQQDLDDLERFYASAMTDYLGKPVRDFTPPSVVYPVNELP
ncbi:hypothetical protein B0H67DRAFT_687628 [Lasiosphaeris hirsuta]|uniref:Peptidase M10 metallopeptidase domain-containing protein n=1 Tax=Lasiosphaeris hirsuta TaxID=260670 RepID=A0AA39ZXT2_9PEZI|nr:hypothetical protein B0H67DRAFT_687628 [Lasiosphaeris hirsuta]